MQKHLEFQVVTPRTLAEFHGETLVLPNVRILTDQEKGQLKKYVAAGRRLVITGADVTGLSEGPNVVRFSDCPGKAYMATLDRDFDHTQPDSQQTFLNSLRQTITFSISAPASVATSMVTVDHKLQIFFANFTGLRGHVNPVQTPLAEVHVTVSNEKGGEAFFLPFLGDVQEVKGVPADNAVSYILPTISKGAVFWYEPAPAARRR